MSSSNIYLNFSVGAVDFNLTSITTTNWNHYYCFTAYEFQQWFSRLLCKWYTTTKTYWNGTNTHLPGMKGQTIISGTIIIGKNITNDIYFNGELKKLKIWNVIRNQNSNK